MPGIMGSTGIAFSNVIFTRAPCRQVLLFCVSALERLSNLHKFVWLGAGETRFGFRVPGSSVVSGSPPVLTCPAGPVALRGEAGVATADLIDGNHPELVVDIWGQLEDG